MKETDNLEAAKYMNNNREDKIKKDPNCALNVTIFEDLTVKDDQKSFQR